MPRRRCTIYDVRFEMNECFAKKIKSRILRRVRDFLATDFTVPKSWDSQIDSADFCRLKKFPCPN
jgi:hypothetical protein